MSKRLVFITVKVEVDVDDKELETLAYYCRRLRNKFAQVLGQLGHYGEVLQCKDENDKEVLSLEDYGL